MTGKENFFHVKLNGYNKKVLINILISLDGSIIQRVKYVSFNTRDPQLNREFVMKIGEIDWSSPA